MREINDEFFKVKDGYNNEIEVESVKIWKEEICVWKCPDCKHIFLLSTHQLDNDLCGNCGS